MNSSIDSSTSTKKPTKVVKFDPSAMLLHVCQHPETFENPIQTVKELLKNDKVDINKIFSPHQCLTPLHIACSHGNIEITKILIDAGSFVNVYDTEGWTPLHCASAEGHVEIIILLGKCQGKIGERGEEGWIHVMDGPIDLIAENEDNDTPEDVAIESKQIEIKHIISELKKKYPPPPKLSKRNQEEYLKQKDINNNDFDEEENKLEKWDEPDKKIIDLGKQSSIDPLLKTHLVGQKMYKEASLKFYTPTLGHSICNSKNNMLAPCYSSIEEGIVKHSDDNTELNLRENIFPDQNTNSQNDTYNVNSTPQVSSPNNTDPSKITKVEYCTFNEKKRPSLSLVNRTSSISNLATCSRRFSKTDPIILPNQATQKNHDNGPITISNPADNYALNPAVPQIMLRSGLNINKNPTSYEFVVEQKQRMKHLSQKSNEGNPEIETEQKPIQPKTSFICDQNVKTSVPTFLSDIKSKFNPAIFSEPTKVGLNAIDSNLAANKLDAKAEKQTSSGQGVENDSSIIIQTSVREKIRNWNNK